jgi:hypothetical protein
MAMMIKAEREEGLMQVPSQEERRSVIAIIVKWWRKWSDAESCLAEPPPHPVPMSEDMGVSAADFRTVAELRALAAHGPDEATLLPRRMAALCFDPDEVARLEPRVFRGPYWRSYGAAGAKRLVRPAARIVDRHPERI